MLIDPEQYVEQYKNKPYQDILQFKNKLISQIDEFDFIVEICYDNLIAAKYGLSAIAKDFKKIFDATSEPESKYISSENITDYEIGWQPCK